MRSSDYAALKRQQMMERPPAPSETCECNAIPPRRATVPDPVALKAHTDETVAAVLAGRQPPATPKMRYLCDRCAKKAGWLS